MERFRVSPDHHLDSQSVRGVNFRTFILSYFHTFIQLIRTFVLSYFHTLVHLPTSPFVLSYFHTFVGNFRTFLRNFRTFLGNFRTFLGNFRTFVLSYFPQAPGQAPGLLQPAGPGTGPGPGSWETRAENPTPGESASRSLAALARSPGCSRSPDGRSFGGWRASEAGEFRRPETGCEGPVVPVPCSFRAAHCTALHSKPLTHCNLSARVGPLRIGSVPWSRLTHAIGLD